MPASRRSDFLLACHGNVGFRYDGQSVYGISARNAALPASVIRYSWIEPARSIQPFSSNVAIVVRLAGSSSEAGSSRPDASLVSALRS